ncbi:DNA adenine methylase [Almyronema epifaneia]|uniref:Site-specific DNA-methyltransferase (adenine-specific) n=1 Tax=Almyronema epifaneia S1 TaxID=2991925 RepID=A0ABW6IB03_9CYAN
MPLPAFQSAPARPFLKWAGGKGQLIAQYQPYFPSNFKTYHEPFLGGGAVFFHLAERLGTAILMDINPELVNVYRCIRDQVEAVIELLKHHKQNHCKDYYYQIRSTPGASAVERAARLIYLNKTCYNGLYRENSKGQFNVPMGRYKNPRICDADLLRRAAATLKPTQIVAGSFNQILEHATGAEDFVYLDPPYHPISETSCFTAYSRYSFGAHDQETLQQVFRQLAARQVRVMLSNSDCPFIRHLYGDFYIHRIQATRNINSKAQRRGHISELLITSYPVASECCQQLSCQSVPSTAIAAI